MLRTFNIGILLGIAVTAALLYLVPAVDQQREPSLVSVQPNGGNSEAFHINLPQDRILLGANGVDAPVPATLEWPDSGTLANFRTELFKFRDAHDVVVGIASKISGAGEATGPFAEWTLHLPARGTLYVIMQPASDAAPFRLGTLRAGTHEFANMQGSVRTRFLGAAKSPGLDAGRIELITALVGIEDEDE